MKTILQKLRWWELLVITLLLLFIFRYIHAYTLPQSASLETTSFDDFFKYNFLFNASLWILRVMLASLLLMVIGSVVNLKYTFSTTLKASLLASYIYFIQYIGMLFYVFVIGGTYSREKWQLTQASFQKLFNVEADNLLGSYLSGLNVWAVIYIVALAFLVSYLGKSEKQRSMYIIGGLLTVLYLLKPLIIRLFI
jgi:hypothetical protein